MLVNFGIALQCFHENVEVIRERNIVDFAQPNLHMLDIDSRHETMRTDLILVEFKNEFGAYDVALLVAPVEGFKVVVVLLLVGPQKLIFVNLLPCFKVAQCPELPLVFVRTADISGVLPLVGVELGGFYMNGRFRSHAIRYYA